MSASRDTDHLERFLTGALPRLKTWLDERGLGEGPLETSPMAGGTQNLLLRLRRGEDRFVVRRRSLVSDESAGRVTGREARVLSALSRTPVPHPRLLGYCDDLAVFGAPFLLMEDVEGFCPRFGLPEAFAADPDAIHRMGLTIVDAAVELSMVDHHAADLADLGSTGWLERQVERWRRQLHGYQELDGQGADRLPGADLVADWLETHHPVRTRLGVLHGDFHLANMLIDHTKPEVNAIVDWELATIGDPLLDLGHLLVTWPKGGAGPPELAALPLPEPAELIDHYLARTGRGTDDVRWFEVLAGYRLAILLEGTPARARVGKASPAVGRRLHGLAETLMHNALAATDTHH